MTWPTARRLPAALATMTFLWAAQAQACPFCAAGQNRYAPGFSLLIGMMLILPFAAVGLVLRQVLRSEEPDLTGGRAGFAPGFGPDLKGNLP